MLRDRDIREPLFEFLEETYGKIRIIEEKTMGRSRADVIMVADAALYGIEIKSDADSYARLASQVKDYDRYYDFNIAVVGSSHAMHIREHVPEYWGVITVEELEEGTEAERNHAGLFGAEMETGPDGDAGGAAKLPSQTCELDFYILQQPKGNPKVTWKRKLEILWRPELAGLQELHGMPKYKEKSKTFVVGKVAEWIEKGKIDEDTLRREISEILFERDYTTIQEELTEYRRGEIAKVLDNVTDPVTQVELLTKRLTAKRNLKKRTRGRRR